MNDPKTINGQDTAVRYSLSSSIRAISEKFTTKPIVRMGRTAASIRPTLRTFGVWQRLIFAYAIPVAAVSGAVVGTCSLGSSIKYTPNLFFCAVVLSSWLGGVGAGIFSILLSVISLDYYFLPPIYALGLSLEETPDMILFVTAGLFVNWVNREGNQTKKSTREARAEGNPQFSEKNHELGKTHDLLRVENSSGGLVDRKLDDESSGTKDVKQLSEVPNVIADKVEPDEELRRKFCTGEPNPDKTQVVLNGSRKPLRNPLTRRSGRDSVFCKQGDYWTIQFEGQVAWLKATRGLECLACLPGQPGREFHVGELVGSGPPATEPTQHRVQQDGHRMRTAHFREAGPILDAHAKADYKLRLAELREELKDAERFNDLERAERIEEESGVIAGQLAVAVGLGGRNRRTASHAERARSAVTKRIRGSIQRIAKTSPSLGRHLAASIKTGYFCSYDPDPDCSIRWKLGS
jgi:hypothetical protein